MVVPPFSYMGASGFEAIRMAVGRAKRPYRMWGCTTWWITVDIELEVVAGYGTGGSLVASIRRSRGSVCAGPSHAVVGIVGGSTGYATRLRPRNLRDVPGDTGRCFNAALVRESSTPGMPMYSPARKRPSVTCPQRSYHLLC